MKLLIIGHGRHGKDTLAEILYEEYGMTFTSSSQKAAELFLFDELKDEFGYETFEDCYLDRNSTPEMRKIWYDKICEFNKQDLSRLTRTILQTSDIYVGLRDRRELIASYHLFDLIVWVDAGKRLPLETGSMNISSDDADIIIDNNQGLLELQRKVKRVFDLMLK